MTDMFMENADVTTEWNSSQATLMRIDVLLRQASNASINDEYLYWYKILQCLKREAIVKMNHKRPKGANSCEEQCPRCHLNNNFTQLREHCFYYMRAQNKQAVGMNLYPLLDETEILMREFMDKKGMLLKDSKDFLQKIQYE